MTRPRWRPWRNQEELLREYDQMSGATARLRRRRQVVRDRPVREIAEAARSAPGATGVLQTYPPQGFAAHAGLIPGNDSTDANDNCRNWGVDDNAICLDMPSDSPYITGE